MPLLSEHMIDVKPSAVSVMSARALEMERQGKDIIRLTAGEPDFAVPDHIKMAAIKAVADNQTKYPPVIGLPELREAICGKLQRNNHLSYQPEQVIVSAGCKQVLYNALAATLDPGDEVILPCPYWMSYPAMVKINRGVPVSVPTRREDGFKIRKETLAQAITPRTKWLILNSPNNPTGAVYSHKDMESLAEVLMEHPRVWVLCDDIYEFLVYDGQPFVNLLNVAPEMKNRVLVVNGFSKAYCMPGLRVGYGAGPVELIKAMFKIQTQSTSGACTISQWAGVAALLGDQSFLNGHNKTYQERRDLVVSLINQIEGLSCEKPQGAFYCFVSCQGVMGKKSANGQVISSDEDWINYLLEEMELATVPGKPFGLSPYFRISFATDIETLRKGCDRIAEACAGLR